MGREQRQDIGVIAPDQFHHFAVLGHVKAQTTVFFGDLHTESTKFAQPVEDMRRILARFVNGRRVHLSP